MNVTRPVALPHVPRAGQQGEEHPYRRWGPRIVRAAAADRRLYMSAFTRTSAAVVRRRYRPASASRVDEILASYDHTIEASTRATSKLDNLALALDASTWPLAALHAEPQWVLRAFGPRETSAPDGSANSPVRHRRVAARVSI
jgi:hypothetical protein